MSMHIPFAIQTALEEQLLHALPDDLKSRILTSGQITSWKKNQHLYRCGDPIDNLYFLLTGKLKDYYCDSSGTEFLRRIILPNDMVAVYCPCHPVLQHSSSCCALCSSSTFRLSRIEFDQLARTHIQLASNLTTFAIRQGERSCRYNCLIRKRLAKARVAGYLLSRMQDRPVTEGEPLPENTVVINLRPLNLAADEICLARETFSRILIELEREQLITNNRGTVTIRRQDSLMAISINE